MVFPSDLERQSHAETIKDSFKSQVLNIPKNEVCWTSLYNLFQCYTSLTEGLYCFPIVSNLNLSCCCFQLLWFIRGDTSLLWEENFFLFSITPHKVQKTANRSQSASQLQAQPSYLSFYSHLYKSHICVYISHTPVSYLFWWHSAGLSPVSYSQGTRIGQCTPGSASWMPGRRELSFLLGLPTHSCQQKPVRDWWYCLKGMCLFLDQVAVHHSPRTATALLVSLQHILVDGIIIFEEEISTLHLLYMTGKGFSKDFLNMPIFFLKESYNILEVRQHCGAI